MWGAGWALEAVVDDPASAYDFVLLVKYGGLAGGDGALGLVEASVDEAGASGGEGGGGGGVAVTDFDGDAELVAGVEVGDGDPVEAVGVEVAGEEVGVGADGDLMGVRVDVEDVEGLGAGEAEAFALADGEGLDALVVADDFAGGGDEFSGGVGEGLVLLVEVGLEEGVVVSAGDEADLLGVGLGGDVETGFGGHDADGWLLHFAEGE